jgi:hypothetical protein
MGVKPGLSIKGRTQIEGVQERGTEEYIWTKEGVAGGWRKFRNEELHDFFSSAVIIRMIK